MHTHTLSIYLHNPSLALGTGTLGIFTAWCAAASYLLAPSWLISCRHSPSVSLSSRRSLLATSSPCFMELSRLSSVYPSSLKAFSWCCRPHAARSAARLSGAAAYFDSGCITVTSSCCGAVMDALDVMGGGCMRHLRCLTNRMQPAPPRDSTSRGRGSQARARARGCWYPLRQRSMWGVRREGDWSRNRCSRSRTRKSTRRLSSRRPGTHRRKCYFDV